jgi:hypothetical protein
VITTKLGTAVVRNPPGRQWQVPWLKEGDRLDVLSYAGEGWWNFWYQGQFDNEAMCPDCDVELISEPTTEWWALIRNANGREGWTRETNRFGNKDACQ